MLAVVAGTMTVVMAMGDFDLSVGSMASLAGIVAALVFISGGSAPLAVGAALAVPGSRAASSTERSSPMSASCRSSRRLAQ